MQIKNICISKYKNAYFSSLWKTGFWMTNASKKAWYKIHPMVISCIKLGTDFSIVCLKRWDFITAMNAETITMIIATRTGSAPIIVAFNTASMATEHSGRTISNENEKNWTPSNMIVIDGGRLSASPDFCKNGMRVPASRCMLQFYIERNDQLTQCDKANETSHCY